MHPQDSELVCHSEMPRRPDRSGHGGVNGSVDHDDIGSGTWHTMLVVHDESDSFLRSHPDHSHVPRPTDTRVGTSFQEHDFRVISGSFDLDTIHALVGSSALEGPCSRIRIRHGLAKSNERSNRLIREQVQRETANSTKDRRRVVEPTRRGDVLDLG